MQIQHEVQFPRCIKPGDCIGIVAPASPFEPSELYSGIDLIERMGFRVRFSEKIFNRSGFLAGTDEERAVQLNDAFNDHTVHAILCARGGYGSMRILPYIDYGTIRRHPKLLMGFSDITALLCALYQRSGLISCHGPVISSLMHASSKTIDSVFNMLTNADPLSIFLENGIILRPGKAFGPLICGNLTTLCHLVGTPYQPVMHGHILMIEDHGEKPYRIDRMLTQMKLAGVFNGLQGVGVGSFDNCGEMDELFDIMIRTFYSMQIPILAGFQIGHGAENIAVPFGRFSILDTDRHEMMISPGLEQPT